jgi:hypothetical protein
MREMPPEPPPPVRTASEMKSARGPFVMYVFYPEMRKSLPSRSARH